MRRQTKAVKGVNSEGFITIVHPAANAGATFQALKVFRGRKVSFYPLRLPYQDGVVPGDA